MDIILQKEHCTLNHWLGNLLADSFSEGHQFAVWRKPNSSYLQVIIDKTSRLKKVPMAFEELPAGFIIHPFEDQEDKKGYFLEASSYFKVEIEPAENGRNYLINSEIENRSPSEISDTIKNALSKLKNPTSVEYHEENGREDFIRIVDRGIEAVKSEQLHKIVPARIKKIELNEDFDLVKSILNLIDAYPNAFINFFHIPEIGTWIGASPEILIRTRGDDFYTMSLAATQKAHGEYPLKSAAWTQKEIEEQALVSRYIVDCFKKIRLREYDEHGPKTVLAGNLLHLRSDFKVNMKATNFPQLGSVMLELLHPTSAVCGMPRKPAIDFLKAHEKFDRSLFAGFIGPVNIEEETSIYVNLRTARLLDGAAILYAGAGVTEDSIPEKEWEETEMKCEIIEKHLKSHFQL